MNLCIHAATAYLKRLMTLDIVLDILLKAGDVLDILRSHLIEVVYLVTNTIAQLACHMVNGI